MHLYKELLCLIICLVYVYEARGVHSPCDPLTNFDCNDGSPHRCIPLAWKCDGKPQCISESDENTSDCDGNFHSERECLADERRCSPGGECKPVGWFCDKKVDCPNGEDEKDCPIKKCSNKEFFCGRTGQCINYLFTCDDKLDCAKDTEEDRYCECSSTNVYRCKDKSLCLPTGKVCDGVQHCHDISDEGGQCDEKCSLNCGDNGVCYQTPEGSQCLCNEGYHYKDGSCLDVNECNSGLDKCDHHCRNTEGGYLCYCTDKYHLEGKFICKADSSSPARLFYTHSKDIMELDLKTGGSKEVASCDSVTIAVAYDPFDNTVYWSTLDNKVFYKHTSLDEINRVFLRKDIGRIHDMKIDWLGRNLYLADSDKNQMVVCSVKSVESCRSLFTTPVNPRSLVLDLKRKRIYWTDLKVKKIFVSNMDGTALDVLVDSGLDKPNAISLDSAVQKLYWMDAGTGKIEVYDLVRRQRNEVTKDGISSPYSMAIWENKIFWSGWEHKSISYANKKDGSNITKLIAHSEEINGINLFQPQMLDETGESPCGWAGCSHLCFITAHSNHFRCECPAELKLSSNNKDCIEFKEEASLVIGDASDLFQVKDRKYTEHVVNKIPDTQELASISDLDYDPSTNKLYISDKGDGRKEGQILVMDMSPNSIPKVVIENVYNPNAIAVDWSRGNLYWVDPFKRQLHVASLSGGYSAYRTRLPMDINCRGLDIAINLRSGHLLLACDSPKGKILKCTRSGAPCTELVSGIRSPLGISIDKRSSEADTVYWSESYTDSIHAIFMNGTNRRTITFNDAASVLFSHGRLFVTRVGDHHSVYEIDGGDNSLTVLNLNAQSFHNNRDHMAITEIGWRLEPLEKETDFCRAVQCSQICLEDEYKKPKCFCEDGKEIDSDGKSCVPKKCGDGKFTCISSGLCIPEFFKCDQVNNCQDGSDELQCSRNSCNPDEFQCVESGKCVQSHKKCDGNIDCNDQSDEKECQESCSRGYTPCEDGNGCYLTTHKCTSHQAECADYSDQKGCPPCNEDQFSCAIGHGCVQKSFICDGYNDCLDGSDEINCKTPCQSNQFKCESDQFCIDNSKKCDGERNCPYGEDEMLELCGNYERDCSKIENCTVSCQINEFSCNSQKQCIDRNLQCDGVPQCLDASDEKNCESLFTSVYNVAIPVSNSENYGICGRGEFTCPSGNCIAGSLVCDGVINCDDGGDESTECQKNCDYNGGCKQICTPRPDGRRCSCRHGYKIADDGVSCEDIDECLVDDPCQQICTNVQGVGGYDCSCLDDYFLDVNDRTCRRRDGHESVTAILSGSLLDWLGHDRLGTSGSIAMPPGFSTSHIAFYEGNEHLLLLHPSGTLAAVSPTNLQWSPLMTNLKRPTAIDYDSASGNFYLSQILDEVTGVLMVCSSQTFICNRIFKESNSMVSAVTVAPISKKLFFCVNFDTVKRAHLVISEFDGSDVKILARDMQSCDGIAVDEPKKTTFYIDNIQRKIFSINWEGYKKTLYKEVAQMVKTLDIDGYYLQWLEADGSLQRCKKKDSKDCLTPTDVGHSPVLATLVAKAPTEGGSVCKKNSCPTLCLSSGNISRCVCDDLMSEDCWKPTTLVPNCAENSCSPGGECIINKDLEEVCRCYEGYSGRSCSVYASARTSRKVLPIVITVIILLLVIGLILGYLKYKRDVLPLFWWNKKSSRNKEMAFPNPAYGAPKEEIDGTLLTKAPHPSSFSDTKSVSVTLNADLKISGVE